MSAFLDVVASANIKDTLTAAQASAAVAKVIGQLPSAGHKPELIGLQEWDGGAPDCIKATVYRFRRAPGGGGPVIYDATRYGPEPMWMRTRVLAKAGFVGNLPGRKSRLGESKAALYCFADELGYADTVAIVAHLTAEVQKGKRYRRDWRHLPRVLRHRLEVLHLRGLARWHTYRKRRVYVFVDANFDGMELPPLVSCWAGHPVEERAGTLGNRAVDYVYAPDKSLSVRLVSTASDHDAVVCRYHRKSNLMKYTPAQVKKAIVAAATFAANLVAAGVIDGKASLIVMAAVSALGVYGVFAVKNAD